MNRSMAVPQDGRREWWIHLTHEGGTTQLRFRGTEIEAAKQAASYVGKPASWNCTKGEPNLWDAYTVARIEEIAP